MRTCGKTCRADEADAFGRSDNIAFGFGDRGKMHIYGKETGQVFKDYSVARDDTQPGEDNPARRAGEDIASLLRAQVYASVEGRIAAAVMVEIAAFVGKTRGFAPCDRERLHHGALGEERCEVFGFEYSREGLRFGGLHRIGLGTNSGVGLVKGNILAQECLRFDCEGDTKFTGVVAESDSDQETGRTRRCLRRYREEKPIEKSIPTRRHEEATG